MQAPLQCGEFTVVVLGDINSDGIDIAISGNGEGADPARALSDSRRPARRARPTILCLLQDGAAVIATSPARRLDNFVQEGLKIVSEMLELSTSFLPVAVSLEMKKQIRRRSIVLRF
jgi:hypothetical protein